MASPGFGTFGSHSGGFSGEGGDKKFDVFYKDVSRMNVDCRIRIKISQSVLMKEEKPKSVMPSEVGIGTRVRG